MIWVSKAKRGPLRGSKGARFEALRGLENPRGSKRLGPYPGTPFPSCKFTSNCQTQLKTTPTCFNGGDTKNKKHKHINIFVTALRDDRPRTNHTPSQGQNGDVTVEFNRKWRVCPRDASCFSRDGIRLWLGRVLFVLNTVPPKLFMFIGFFLPE